MRELRFDDTTRSNLSKKLRKAFEKSFPNRRSEENEFEMEVTLKILEGYALPKEMLTAMGVERLFWDEGLKFTTSNNGLAAECLRAVYQLPGFSV